MNYYTTALNEKSVQVMSTPQMTGHYNMYSIPERHHHTSFPIIPTTAIQVAAVPLPCSCSLCNDNFVQNLINSTIKVPVQVENELLSRSPPPHLPPLRFGRGIKRKPEEDRNRTNVTGLSKWYLKRRTDQMLATSISKNKLHKTQKVLKRLNNANARYLWKMEKRYNFDERESIRESKLEMLRRKGIKAPCRNECTLWNCPRKEYKRKRPFMPVDLPVRSASRLSNLSTKSRSPIVFHRST